MAWVVFFVGVGSLGISLYLGYRFATMGLVVGTALALEKLVDVIDVVVTLVFAGNFAATGSNEIEVMMAAVLRMFICIPSALAGVHLWGKIKRFTALKQGDSTSDGRIEVYTTVPRDRQIEQIERALQNWKAERKATRQYEQRC